MWGRSKPQGYTNFRTFIFGITSQSMFPNGVIYEGVSEEPMSFRGESGANDSMVPMCDNLLQVQMPETPLTDILKDFRQYRPGNHREFLEAVRDCAQQSGVREFAKGDSVSAALYLQALDQVRDFRWRHWCFTREYILKHTSHPTATGGSPIVTALSEFADYVQKQQALRRPPGQAPAVLEDHDELSILDELGLSDDNKTHVRLKTLLTDPAEENVAALAEHIKERLAEGHGEVLFDVGMEDSGDSMGFTKSQWDFALERIGAVCEQIKADYKMLMTRNVGGDVEVGPRDAKDTGFSGKMILRQQPQSVDDVIETRIAVVGNGEFLQA
ncbi:hypothetical protein IG631_03412 [Alternaria alternata]|nr:hypothetical protein IG631_03412 [Alternaria alternata]